MTSWPLLSRRDHESFVRNHGHLGDRLRTGSPYETAVSEIRRCDYLAWSLASSRHHWHWCYTRHREAAALDMSHCRYWPSSRAQVDRKGREGKTHPHSADLSSLSLHPPGESATSWKTVTLGRNYFSSVRVLFILYFSLRNLDQRDQSPLHLVGFR
ncbi:uncharacterized protein LY79DRAFT_26618 [Colletotrichum navitas]|uniref:Uncharacterized protein n=1 Tax=Colletotrichum navitas TaxID=681940 RepID=A0AAD8QG00_9PEZI|nr:uncharacterized protein LY79DRAFT_26618 [Colletotrichum navitas]KAK1600643.1 hypothetical protein LY79DRAFT_26618 [Colletotrichum navitas]